MLQIDRDELVTRTRALTDEEIEVVTDNLPPEAMIGALGRRFGIMARKLEVIGCAISADEIRKG